MIRFRLLLTAAALAIVTTAASAADSVILRRDGQTHHVTGRVIVEAEDGGLLVVADDGFLWAVQPDELVEHKKDDKPFEPLGKEELAKRLLAELPDGFKVYTTVHYVICYNTSTAYAQWCGALYERLYRGFTNYWSQSQRGFDVKPPDAPLVAVVFQDKASYARYAKPELGDAADAIVGYYSLRTNRVTMYNLTGVGTVGGGRRLTSAKQINAVLSSPKAAQTVATIVHEATHQIAFNCGLTQRWGDVPMWVSEGIAVYFETPDLKSRTGWRTIGAVNRTRLVQFRQYLQRRPADSLQTLLGSNERFRDAKTAVDAYAESWALNYYLLKRRPKDYVAYLKLLAEKTPLTEEEPARRLRDFQSVFGADLKGLDADFVRRMGAIR